MQGKSLPLQPSANRVVVGRIGAPHGVRGELRVIPLTDFPDRFDCLQEIMAGEELLHICGVRHHKQFVILRFEEYPSREAAAALTGRLLTVAREDAAPLGEGEFYTFDIIGLEAVTPEGAPLGVVEQVLRTGSNDVYALRSGDGREILVPALRRVVKEINIPEGRMVVDLQEQEPGQEEPCASIS